MCSGFWIWLWLCLVGLPACAGRVTRVDTGNGPPAQVKPTVLVVTLRGKVGTQELARCTRTLREAETEGCSYVVFRLEDAGSQGEDQDRLQSLLDRVQKSVVPTIALLKGRVTQSAACLALCATRLYCAPGTYFGEITKPEQDWRELLSGSPEAAMARRLDGLREAMAGRLDQRREKLRPDAVKLALAMVDPRTQLIEATVREGGFERPRILTADELAALQSTGAKILRESPLERPLMLTAQKAEDFGLSNGTLQGLDQLAEVLTVDPKTMGELTVDWTEHMVAWLELLQPFLLVAGFVLILLEIKTPGVGLPGLLGVLFLGLAMFHSYLVGLAEVTEILVFFLGLAAIAVEIFLLPGTILFGGVGFLCLLLALVLSRQSFVLPSNAIEEDILLANLTNLTLLIVLVLILGFVMWRILPRVPWFNRLFLKAPEHGLLLAGAAPSGLGLANAALMALVGRSGVAATILRPTGVMEIDGERVDVVTEGEFVEPGTALRVLYVQGHRVVVTTASPAAPGAPDARSGERGSVGVVVLLAILGLGLIVAEVFFVSFGIIAILAGLSLITAVFFAFQESTTFGFTMLVVEAIMAPVVLASAFKVLPKTRFGKQLILAGPVTDGSAGAVDPELAGLLHKTGVTISPLRPAGYARIDGKKVDVVTRGEMLEANCPVKVLDVAQNRVVVGRC